ncbi:MAG: hypothetical protein ORN56_02170 [Chitinophagales bacterium]|nr:hypothetical protein [Chitinophagales bacterium]
MRSFLYNTFILFILLQTSLSTAFAGTSSLKLNVTLEKSEIKKGEFTVVHYELSGSDRDLLGASVSLQGFKLVSNKGYEILTPDSSITYVFQVLKYNKPVLTKSFTVYIISEGKTLSVDPNISENLRSEQILAASNQSQTEKSIKRGRPKSLRLNIDLDRSEISKGDSALLHYRLNGKAKHLAGAYIMVDGAKLTDTRGVITLHTDSSKLYTFEVRKNDILLIKKQVSISIIEDKPVENLMAESANARNTQAYSTKTRTSSISSNNSVAPTEDNSASANKESDGRFNIIGGGKYLTYSGNTNSSSSHFIIQVGDAIASNDPNLKNTTYLKAQEQLEVPFEQGSTLAEDVFYFENIRIVQRLTPVDSLLNPIVKNTWGSVYKIEYELENYSLQDKVINFLTLSDFMLDKNDNPRAYINQTKLLNSWSCDKSEMPESIQLRLKNSSTNMRARCILKNNQLNGPDSLSYGNWQFLRQLTYLGKNKNQEVVDNALLLKWSKLPIGAQTKKTISYAYGFTGQGKVDLELINTSIHFIESVLYFNMGANQVSTKIWKLERKKLAEMKPSLEHIELIGHTDAKGNAVSNIRLSKLRCLGIKLLMIAEGVDKNIISIKPMGEQEADQSSVSRKKGRREDRKVVIHYFVNQQAQR